MKLQIGNAPCSWGVERPNDPENPSWQNVLDQNKAAGFKGIELGPVGFFPEDPNILGPALAARELELTAGVVFRPFHDPSAWEDVLDGAHRTFKALVAHGAKTGVLIDSIAAERALTSGRPDESRRLDKYDWAGMMQRVETIAKIGSEEYGLTVALHGHAAGFIEYQDEIENTLDSIDEKYLSLCIDTGHCLFAGFDPVAFYQKHQKRTRYLHFKDTDPVVKERVIRDRVNFYEAIKQGLFCNLGKGECDFKSLFQTMEQAQFNGWATVEQECDPLAQSSLIDAIANHSYLDNLMKS
jgi:inosose dehydratase